MKYLLAAALSVLFMSQGVADEADTCLSCHAKDVFEEVSSVQIIAALKDPRRDAHQPYRDLSNEQLEAIAKEVSSIPLPE